MRNVLLVFRRDMSNLFKNVMSVIVMVGLIVLPSLFAWYNILACWDVFTNTGNLTVAVANQDQGYESDLVPINVNVGEKVVSALRANDQINWVFTSGDDAIEGTKSGKYYAAVVMPESFSKNMLTFYEGDSHQVSIDYYVNEKKNAIAPRITDTGADTVSKQINDVFAQTVSEIALGLTQSLARYAQENDADGQIGVLTERMRAASNRMDQTADVLGLYSSLANDAQDLVKDGVELVDSAKSQAGQAASSIEKSKARLIGLSKTVEKSVNGLSKSLAKSSSSLDELEVDMDALLEDTAEDVEVAAAGLREKASEIDERAKDTKAFLSLLQQASDAIPIQHTLVLGKAIAKTSEMYEVLQQVSKTLTKAADGLESGRDDALKDIESLKKLSTQAKTRMKSVKTDFDKKVKPAIKQLSSDVAKLSADLDRGSAGLRDLDGGFSQSAGSVSDALGTASGKVDDTVAKLQSAAKSMRRVADAIDAALASGDTETLRTLLQGDVDDLAQALAAPVQVERIALFPSENFGSAMAPLYCTLALFIGSLLIMVALKPQVSKQGREELRNPKPRQLYFGRFGVVAFISLMQTTLMGLGNMLLLRVQVADPLLFMVCYWFSGLVFAFIVYTLVVAFENLGKGISVLLLIIQVTGCGGSYPLQILPDFVQQISPFLPATHVVNAMRAAMMGVYQNDFWISLAYLAAFIIPALLLGLVLRKPLERFMRFYISKVEASKLME